MVLVTEMVKDNQFHHGGGNTSQMALCEAGFQVGVLCPNFSSEILQRLRCLDANIA